LNRNPSGVISPKSAPSLILQGMSPGERLEIALVERVHHYIRELLEQIG
jgi:hypothetical protein